MADKRITLTFDATMDVSKVRSSVSEIQKVLNGLSLPKGMQTSTSNMFQKLQDELNNYNALTSKTAHSIADVKQADKSLQNIMTLFEKINGVMKQIGADPINFIDPADLKKINAAQKALEKAKEAMSKTAISTKKASIAEQLEKAKKTADELNKKVDALNKDISSKKTSRSSIEEALKKARDEAAQLEKELAGLTANPVNKETKTTQKDGKRTTVVLNSEEYEAYLNKLNETKRKLAETEEKIKEFNKSLSAADTSRQEKELSELEEKADQAARTVAELDEKLKHVGKDTKNDAIKKLRDELADLTGKTKSEIPTTITKIEEFVESLSEVQKVKVKEALDKMNAELEETGREGKKAAQGMDEARKKAEDLTRTAQEVDNLKNQILDFFSITNTIQIFKNAISDAFDTVKELDKAMTETAVVTDFDIGDMWDQLPKYTEAANKLGTTTLGAYETMTLFYQQGLNTNETFEIGTETMKMARIAGLDYADATDKMTAALRGFNMELNAASAQRVNDVYSELAAITAADTEEIANAMTKTASIADNANMEFETTAAFLSQIIETTRESAETAGTAMKTVIARFQELKKDPSLIGEVDGEMVDANKIETALKSIGVALRDTSGQFRDLDDVFLDIAKKWKGLDINTQRYIATIAAGSRQQSRFIAMMSNYDRTMELVAAATNSAGASQKQFEKTTDSLESKLNRLSNAWDAFTMGLANNELIKLGVDLLTGLLNTINTITGVLPGAGEGIAKLLITIGALKAGGAIFDGFFTNLKKTGDDAMGPIEALFGSIKSTGKGAIETIGGISAKIKTLGGMGGAIKTVGAAFFGFDKATRAAALGQLGLNTAMAACPIGWIALAIVALIAVIYALAKAWEAASDSFKMEQINKSIDEMNSHIDEAKNTIEELGESENRLKSLQKEFSNLTKGTSEWKDKLIEVNQEVLDLINKYPELSKYLTRSNSGSLDISEEGWDALVKDQERIIQNSSNAKIGMQFARTDLQEKMDYEAAVSEALGKSFGESVDTEAFGRNVGTAIGSLLGGTGMGLFGGLAGPGGAALGIVAGSTTVGAAGGDLGANLGAKYEKEIQGAFSDIGSWMTQAALDVGGFLDSDIARKWIFNGVGSIALNAWADKDGGWEAKAQKATTGGLTQNEFATFLNALGDAQITFDEVTGTFSDPAAAERIFDSLKFDASFEDVAAKAKQLGGVFNELIVSAQGYTQAKDKERDALLTSAISNTSIGTKNYADAIGNILGETLYEDIEPTLKERQDALTDNKKELKQLYAQEVGGFYENGKLYSDSSMETEWDLSKDTMKQAIASAQLAKEMGAEAVKLSEVLNNLTLDQQDLFAQLFSSDGSAITDETYMNLIKRGSELQGDSGELNADWMAKELGFDSLADMAASLGMEVSEVGEMLATNLNAARDRIVKSRKDTVGKMKKYSRHSEATSYDSQATLLAQMEEKYGAGFNTDLQNLFSQVGQAGSDILTTEAFSQFMSIAKNGDENDLAAMNNLINSIDWSNPITAASDLNEALNSSSESARKLAESMLKAGYEAFDSGKQMQYFVQSAEFQDLEDEIAGVIEQQGELSADNILEMADSCSLLKDLMEETGVTSAGLAKILTKFNKGELQMNQLTEAVMAAMGSFDSLNSLVAETLKTLSEFDPGMDENEVSEFISTYYETLNSNLEKGAVGNSQNFNILDFMFGEGWDDNLSGDALVERMNYLSGVMEQNSADMRASWADLAAGKDVYGNTFNKSALGFNVTDTGEKIDITGFEGMTTDQIVSNIQNAYKVSEDYAKMMLADFKNYSIDLAAELNANDLTAGIEAAYDELNYVGRIDKNGTRTKDPSQTWQKVIDESEIQAIADMYDVAYDEVASRFEAKGALITHFYDKDGFLLQSSEMIAELERVFTSDAGKEAGANWYAGFTSEIDGKQMIDYDGMMAALGQLNIPDSAKASISNDIVQAVRDGAGNSEETVYLDYQMSDGSIQQIEIPANIDVQTAIANAEQNLANAKLGDAIAKAFGNVDVNVTVAEGGLATVTTSITSAVQAADATVKPVVDSGSLNTITSQVSAAIKDADTVAPVSADLTSAKNAINNYQPPSKTMYVYEKIVQQEHAKGIKNSPDTHTALIGEAGAEIHQTEDGAYLADGPQLATINKGDTVYTAKETKKILSKDGVSFPRYASGYNTKYGYKAKDVTGNNTKEDEEDKWENPYDWLYNLTQKINEALRDRERIEKRYDILMRKREGTYEIAEKYRQAELANLREQQKLQEQMLSNRLTELNEFQAENAEFQKYGTYDATTGLLSINWDEINKVTDTEHGEDIEEYISELERISESIEEANDTLIDIDADILDQKDELIDSYLTLEDRLVTALETNAQKEIDQLQDVNDGIDEANSDLMTAISTTIDQMRQERENEKTEESIEDKEARLSYLRQDTTGANALAIKELEAELDAEREEYRDAMIDQHLQALQDKNDLAAEQRQRQVEIMQSQLEWNIENGVYVQEAIQMIHEAMVDGKVTPEDRLYTELAKAEGWEHKSEIDRGRIITEIQQLAVEAKQALAQQQSGWVEYDVGDSYDDDPVGSKTEGTSSSGSNYEKLDIFTPTPAPVQPPAPTPPVLDEKTKKGVSGAIWNGGMGWGNGQERIDKLKECFGTNDIQKNYVNKNVGKWERADSQYSYKNIRKKFKGYKTGGLADYTGPAWLDGTKSKPELVLNATDTDNFIQLRDILRESGVADRSAQNSGDNYYDIDINVDELSSDYDVEQLADKIKQEIAKDAQYRNVNAVKFLR